MDAMIVSIRKWWEKSSKQQRTLAVLFAIGLLATGMLLMISGEQPGGQGDTVGSSLYYAGVMVKLVGVLLLIVGGAVVLRRFQVRSSGMFGRQVKLVETVRIAPKQALHLVQIGNRRLLIGATDTAISLITELDPAADTAQIAEPAAQPLAVEASNFGDILHSLKQNAPEGDVRGQA
jgi:flagellar biosynthetic protein FliO